MSMLAFQFCLHWRSDFCSDWSTHTPLHRFIGWCWVWKDRRRNDNCVFIRCHLHVEMPMLAYFTRHLPLGTAREMNWIQLCRAYGNDFKFMFKLFSGVVEDSVWSMVMKAPSLPMAIGQIGPLGPPAPGPVGEEYLTETVSVPTPGMYTTCFLLNEPPIAPNLVSSSTIAYPIV